VPEPWWLLFHGARENGGVVIILQTGPRHGKVSGAVQSYEGIMGKFIDLTGQRYGAWLVLRQGDKTRHEAMWICRCDCGTEREVSSRNLRHNKSTSCGCLTAAKKRAHNLIHGESCPDTPLYRAWRHIRCRSSRRKSAPIPVCDEWQDYWTFAEWARTHGYRQGLILSRIDIGKGWYPENACFKIKMNSPRGNVRKFPPIPKLDKNGKRKA